MSHTTQTDANPAALDATASMTFTSLDAVTDQLLAATASGLPRMPEGLDGDPTAQGNCGAAESPAADVAEAIEFRVLRSGAPIRRLRMTGNRYTFGSGDGCSIRLSDPSVRPMHAVLIRDAQRTLVRAYSVPVEVNGRQTTETALTVGDVLRIGTYHFELLSTTTDIDDIARSLEFPTAPPPSVLLAEARTAEDRFSPTSESTTGADENVWRERLRREVAQWRARQAECDRREARCDDREANLRGRESELWARAEQLYRREAQLQTQEAAAIQIHEEYAQKQAELINVREESYARQRAYEQREQQFRSVESQFKHKEAAYRQQLEEASRQLEQSQQQAESANQSVQQMREQFEQLNSQIEQLSSQQQRLEHDDSEQQRLLDELQSARDQAVDARAESDRLRQQAEARIETMQREVEELRSEHQAAVSDYESRLEELESLRSSAEAKAEQMSDQLEEIRGKRCELDDDQQAMLAESESRRQQAEQRIAEMTAKLEQLEAEQNEEIRQQQTRLADSETQKVRAQQRVEELVEQLETIDAQQADDRLQQQTRLADSERVAEQLRSQVEQLQEALAQAREEAERMRVDYEEASQSVRELEQLVAEGKQDDEEQQARQQEVDQLRQSVEQLSVELARANGDLSDLREANESLNDRLQEIREQNEDLEHAVASRPTEEAWHSVQQQLDQATSQLASLKQEYDQTLEQLERSRSAAEEADADSEWSQLPESSQRESQNEQNEQSEPSRADEQSEFSEPPIFGDDSAVTQLSAEMDPEFPAAETVLRETVTEEQRQSDVSESQEVQEVDIWGAADRVSDSQAAEAAWKSDSQSDSNTQHESDREEPSSIWGEPEMSVSSDEVDTTWRRGADDDEGQHHLSSEWTPAEEIGPDAEQSWDSVAWDSQSNPSSQQSDGNGQPDQRLDESGTTGSLADALIDELNQDESPRDEADIRQDRPATLSGATQVMEHEDYQEQRDAPVESEPAESWLSDQPAIDDSYQPTAFVAEPNLAAALSDESDAADDGSQLPEAMDAIHPSNDQVELENAEIQAIVGAGGEDDSIEAYMNRLLQRVQGEPDGAHPETVALPKSPDTSVLTSGDPAEPSADPNLTAPVVPIDLDAPLVPRSEAPEKHSNLSAMRRLANESARSAISRSARVHIRDMQIKAVTKFAFAAVALGCGWLCLIFIPGVACYLAASMTVIVAAVCIYEGIVLFAEAKRSLAATAAAAETDMEADFIEDQSSAGQGDAANAIQAASESQFVTETQIVSDTTMSVDQSAAELDDGYSSDSEPTPDETEKP